MIWFALVCISFCRIFFLPFCVLTQQRRGPIWCIYISIYSHCKTKFMQTSELKLFSSTAVAVAQTSNTNFWNVAGVLAWNERIDIFVALLLMYAYYYVHRDNELWMRTLGMRVCVYVRNVLSVCLHVLHCWWWLKHTASFKRSCDSMCSRARSRRYICQGFHNFSSSIHENNLCCCLCAIASFRFSLPWYYFRLFGVYSQ